MEYDVIVVGGGIAGLVATCELIDAKKKVLLLDQEPESSLGGQAFWSFGGLFLVDSPMQRRIGIKDSREYMLLNCCFVYLLNCLMFLDITKIVPFYCAF